MTRNGRTQPRTTAHDLERGHDLERARLKLIGRGNDLFLFDERLGTRNDANSERADIHRTGTTKNEHGHKIIWHEHDLEQGTSSRRWNKNDENGERRERARSAEAWFERWI